MSMLSVHVVPVAITMQLIPMSGERMRLAV